jgi:AraC-like DNA-binding protein
MRLYIKYMVSLRCKMLVKDELQKLGVNFSSVELGMAEIEDELSRELRENLRKRLKSSGLELIDDKKNILAEKITNVIIDMIHHNDEVPKVNDSDYISEKLGYDYTYLSNIFSEVKGTTIQQYIIMQKIEKVKEMLLYDELTLTEIAHKLHYSSVAHLSNQFKKITGITPTHFKEMKHQKVSQEDL